MGLGSGLVVSLAQARDKASEARALVANGRNPIEVKRESHRTVTSKLTFGQCADKMLAAKSSQWRNAKHAAQWRMTLTEYAKPLRDMPVDAIGIDEVIGVLEPFWHSIPETANRLRARIEAVLNFAKVQHLRAGENRPHGAATLITLCRSVRRASGRITRLWPMKTSRASSQGSEAATASRRSHSSF
jgi:Arm DNA-binding domain